MVRIGRWAFYAVGVMGFPAIQTLQDINKEVRSSELPTSSLLQRHTSKPDSPVGYSDCFGTTIHLPRDTNLKDLGTQYARSFFTSGAFSLEAKILSMTQQNRSHTTPDSSESPESLNFVDGDVVAGAFTVVQRTDKEVLLFWGEHSSFSGATWLGLRVLTGEEREAAVAAHTAKVNAPLIPGLPLPGNMASNESNPSSTVAAEDTSYIRLQLGSAVNKPADSWLFQLSVPFHMMYSKILLWGAREKLQEKLAAAPRT
mmetsp:Transcript_18338/g.39432  ORF Transcript_18338/g.39432 Transcript_18338/m.39432 type:complete len:257 (+) Transcript_18338:97-867(+)